MASLCRVYWDRTAKSAARRTLKAIRDDAKELRRLAFQCAVVRRTRARGRMDRRRD